MDHRELHSETVVVTKRRRLVHQLRLLGLLIPLLLLLACMPFGAVIGQASQPSGPTPPGMGVPIAFDDLPPTARCRIAAEFALTTNGLIYSQGGNLKDENGNIIDPIDPRTGTYYPRTGPDSYDCSGMTMVAYGQAGVQIESNTREQVNNGTEVPCTPANLQGSATTCWATGDLAVFLHPDGGPYHVAMYIRDGIFAECLNRQDGCRVWERPANSFPPQLVVRRIVGDCVRTVSVSVGGSWRGQGIRNAMTAMGLGDAIITGQFNDPRGDHRHGGTDFAITEGTPVHALFGGTVEVSEYIDWPNGNYIIIRSPSGQRSYYGHFQTRLVNTDDTVEAGTVIGLVGTTGWVTGPHVHFQITDDSGGEWIDPEVYFGPDTTSAASPFTVPWNAWAAMLAWAYRPQAYVAHTDTYLSFQHFAAVPSWAQPHIVGRSV